MNLAIRPATKTPTVLAHILPSIAAAFCIVLPAVLPVRLFFWLVWV
jgi:hypothetical protein